MSMEFSRQEYWSRLPFSIPRDLPNSGIEPTPLASPALAGGFFTTRATWEAPWTTLPLPPTSNPSFLIFRDKLLLYL